MGLWFFNHAIVGGGIPVASQVKVTGLLIVSTTPSFSGPSIVGGTVKRRKKITCLHEANLGHFLICISGGKRVVLEADAHHIH